MVTATLRELGPELTAALMAPSFPQHTARS